MKLSSAIINGKQSLGLVVNETFYPVSKHNSELPETMRELLNSPEATRNKVSELNDKITSNPDQYEGHKISDLKIVSPVPEPTSCRDAYAFRQHVATARRNRGVDMIPEFDQFPVFYFTNHNASFGPGDIELMPDHFKKLDFELEVAAVIGKKGRNIKAEDADDYIFGYMILNDLSARLLQMEEMKLNLGPAKGKDFGNSFGPYLVTSDELEAYLSPTKAGHKGKQYNLEMKAWHNGKQVSQGNVSQMDWTFAEIIERISYGVDVLPGDIIGSGTVGTGCYLELNGTAKINNPEHSPVWIQPGDNIAMEIENLGRLENKFKMTDSDYSLLSLKKNT